MPEAFKHPDGNTNWTAVIAAVGAAMVLVLQQWQGYRIAEIKAKADADAKNFMSRDEIYKHIQTLEDNFMPRNEIVLELKNVSRSIDDLRDRIDNLDEKLLMGVKKDGNK